MSKLPWFTRYLMGVLLFWGPTRLFSWACSSPDTAAGSDAARAGAPAASGRTYNGPQIFGPGSRTDFARPQASKPHCKLKEGGPCQDQD